MLITTLALEQNMPRFVLLFLPPDRVKLRLMPYLGLDVPKLAGNAAAAPAAEAVAGLNSRHRALVGCGL